MKVLVACEFSGVVREAFRRLSHDSYSCDIVDTTQDGPHILADVRSIDLSSYDLLIAHPPCTHLAVSGARWFKYKKKEQIAAINFFMYLVNAPVKRIAVENPVSIMSTYYRKPDQIIQPWMFGDEFSKKTCLWLKNLPPLESTKIVSKGEYVIHGGKRIPKWYSNRERNRSITFPGIAQAMAEQWGSLC